MSRGSGRAGGKRDLLKEDDGRDAEGKPSTTGQGMKATARPRPLKPSTQTSTPAIRDKRATLPVPWTATTGASTTTMAPVGPDTCTGEPPITAATSPATIAVISPVSAPTPELTPNARASGSATMPTVMPASRSVRHHAASPA
jgi:hypothetical protein